MARPNSRATLIEYCLRQLGDPVIEINVDPDQLEDAVDNAIQFYQDFHSDATLKTYLKHLVTATDVSNEYIPIPDNIIYVQRLFPISNSFSDAMNFFDIKYQMMLNDIADMQNFAGDLAYYDHLQQYLQLLDMKLNGTPIVNFSRRMGRLYIHGDFQDRDIKEGDYLVAEVMQTIDPDTHTSTYDDRMLKQYTTALIKKQWGANLIKFEGMQLPGGVTLNGRQIFEDAIADVERIEEKMRLEYEEPFDFYVG
jgi:hypothetical protein